MNDCKLVNKLRDNELFINEKLGLTANYDISSRRFVISGKDILIYAIGGLTDTNIMNELIKNIVSFNSIKKVFHHSDMPNAIEYSLSNMQIEKTAEIPYLIKNILSGSMVILVDGYSEAFIVDVRKYPNRTPEEAPSEPSVRGSRDGFIESVTVNTVLVRRRIRHESLRFEKLTVGSCSQLDVVVCYMDGKADAKIVSEIRQKLITTKVADFSAGNQTIQEVLFPKKKNPLPYTKITERPDVFAAEIIKGRIGILTDNCPNGLILPITFFDLTTLFEEHDSNTYTATMYRLLSLLFNLILFIGIPLWYYMVLNPEVVPQSLDFLTVTDEYKVPVFFQILSLYIILRIFTLTYFTTPKLFRTSLLLSVTIIVSSAGIESKLLSPLVVLFVLLDNFMARVLYTSEVQGCYVIIHTFQIVVINLFGLYGLFGLLLLILMFTSTRKVFGTWYLYPLIPLNIKKLLPYMIRFKKSKQ